MKRKKRLKCFLSSMLALVMVVTLLPTSALAKPLTEEKAKQTEMTLQDYLYEKGMVDKNGDRLDDSNYSFEVKFNDGKTKTMSYAEIREEAAKHIEDESDTVNIDGLDMTWKYFKSLLAVRDMSDIMENEELADALDEEHYNQTASLLASMLSDDFKSEVKIFLKRVGDNKYTIDVEKTSEEDDTIVSACKLDANMTYYISDDAVAKSDSGEMFITVEKKASDFSMYDKCSVVTISKLKQTKYDKDKNLAEVEVTVERENADEWDSSISYKIYNASDRGANVAKEGTITISSGEKSKKETVTFSYVAGSAELNSEVSELLIKYEPKEATILKLDENGCPINTKSLLLHNQRPSTEKSLDMNQHGYKVFKNVEDISAFGWPIWGAKHRGNYLEEIVDTKYLRELGAEKVRLIVSSNGYVMDGDNKYSPGEKTTVKVISGSKEIYSGRGVEPQGWFDISSIDSLTITWKPDFGIFSFGDKYGYGMALYLNLRYAVKPEYSITAVDGDNIFYPAGSVFSFVISGTAPFASENATVTVAYGDEKNPKETIARVTDIYNGDAALVELKLPDDFTGGKLTVKQFENPNADPIVFTKAQNMHVNCNLSYSEKLESFLPSKASYEEIDGDLCLKLPIKQEPANWYEWIAATGSLGTEGENQYIKSMYAINGSDSSEKLRVYVKLGEVSEKPEYAYVKLPGNGCISNIRFFYYPGMTDVDYTIENADSKGIREAYFDNSNYYFPYLVGAATPFEKEENITIQYNDTWEYYAKSDELSDGAKITFDIPKIYPDKYEKEVVGGKREPLTLSYITDEVNDAGQKYSFVKPKYFSWKSSDETIATIQNKEVDGKMTGKVIFTGKQGTVAFMLTCSNGSKEGVAPKPGDLKIPITITSAMINVSESPDPYLYVPITSETVVTRQDCSATVLFTSNITARNNKLTGATSTDFTLNLYEGKYENSAGGQIFVKANDTALYSITEASTMDNILTGFVIPENVLSKVSNSGEESYIAEIKASFVGSENELGFASGYEKQGNEYIFSTSGKIKVKAKPVDVKMVEMENNYVLDSSDTTVNWTVSHGDENTKWKYTIADTTGEVIDEAGGKGIDTMPKSYTFKEKVSKNLLKEIYTISVYATNDEEADGWTIAGTKVYRYNSEALDIVIENSKHVENASVKEKDGKPSDSAKLDNREYLRSMLSNDGKTLNLEQDGQKISLTDLQYDVNLSTVIRLNYGDFVWGTVSDQISWKGEHSKVEGTDKDSGKLYYHQASQYVNIENLELPSVFPTGECVEQGTADGTVKITATHARTGQMTSVEIAMDRVEDIFYMMQFYPCARTKVDYFDTTGEQHTVYSDDSGQLALLEEKGISKKHPIYVSSTYKDEEYVGMFETDTLNTGEADAIDNELYPVNVYHLTAPGKVSLCFHDSNGRPLTFTNVTLRGGAFYDGEYAKKADLFKKGQEKSNIGDPEKSNGLEDLTFRTDQYGKIYIYYNMSQVTDSKQQLNGGKTSVVDPFLSLKYVYEIRFDNDQYQPELIRVNPYESADVSVTLTKLSGVAKQEFRYNAYLRRYEKGRLKRTDVLDSSNVSGYLGPNGQYDAAEVEIETLLWGDEKYVDSTSGKESVLLKNNFTQCYYDDVSHGRDLLGQGFTRKHQTSEVWIYPFSTIPVITSILKLNAESFGVAKNGDTIKGKTWLKVGKNIGTRVFLRDGTKTVTQIPFDYQIYNGVGNNNSTTSVEAMKATHTLLDELKNKLSDFQISEIASKNDFLRPGFELLSLAASFKGYRASIQFAATTDPTVYYGFISLGADSSENMINNLKNVFKDNDNLNKLNDYIANTSKFGVDSTFTNIEEAYEKYYKKNVKTTDFANYHRDPNSLGGVVDVFNGGSLLVRAKYNPETGKWKQYYISGSIEMLLQLGYEFSTDLSSNSEKGGKGGKTGKTGKASTANVSSGSPTGSWVVDIAISGGFDQLFQAKKTNVQKYAKDESTGKFIYGDVERFDTLRKESISGSFEVGVGYQLSYLVASIKIGIVGSVKVTKEDYTLDSVYYGDENNVTNETERLVATGQIKLRFKVKILFFSYTWEFGSMKFTISDDRASNFNDVMDYWNGGTVKGRKYIATRTSDGKVELSFENTQPEVRMMSLSVDEKDNILKKYGKDEEISNVMTSEDGNYYFYLDDNTVCWADKNGVSKGKLFESKPIFNDENEVGDFGNYYLDVAGKGNNLFATYVTQTQESSMELGEEPTEANLGAAMNSTEITVAHYDGNKWTKENLTKNCAPDMVPKVASQGDKAIVAWTSAYTSNAIDNPLDFDVDNNIMIRQYDGQKWSEPKVAFNALAGGKVDSMDMAMMEDGTSVIAYTVETDEEGTPEKQEIFYSIITPEGEINTFKATENSVIDQNVKIKSIGNKAMLAWYTEEEVKSEDTTNKQKNIRMLCIDNFGRIVEGIPETITNDLTADITANFQIDGKTLDGFSIAWMTQKMEDADAAASNNIYGIQLLEDEGAYVVSPIQLLGSTDNSVTADSFQLQASGNNLNLLLEESDYSDGDIITDYMKAEDILDVDAYYDEAGTFLEEEYNKELEKLNADKDALKIEMPRSYYKLENKTFTFKNNIAVTNVNCNSELVVPNGKLPVELEVKNTGVKNLKNVTIQANGKNEINYEMNLKPGESEKLMYNVKFDENIKDQTFNIQSKGFEGVELTLPFNAPEVEINSVAMAKAENGIRSMDVLLSNKNAMNLPLEGSQKGLKVCMYVAGTDSEGNIIDVPINTTNIKEEDYGLIDNGVLSVRMDVDVEKVLKAVGLEDKNIPKNGIELYTKAVVYNKDTEKEVSSTQAIAQIAALSADASENPVTARVENFEQNEEAILTGSIEVSNSVMTAVDGKILKVGVVDKNNEVVAEEVYELSLGKEEIKPVNVNIPLEKSVEVIDIQTSIIDIKDYEKQTIDNRATSAQEEINQLANLSKNEKKQEIKVVENAVSNAKTAIDRKTTTEDVKAAGLEGITAIDNIVKDAKELDAKNLANGKVAAKEFVDISLMKAKETIRELKNISKKDKEEALKSVEEAASSSKIAIDEKKTLEDIEKAKMAVAKALRVATDLDIINCEKENVGVAREQGKNSINSSAEASKGIIDGLVKLSDEEKVAIKQQIDNAVKIAKDIIDSKQTLANAQNATSSGLKTISDILKRARGLDSGRKEDARERNFEAYKATRKNVVNKLSKQSNTDEWKKLVTKAYIALDKLTYNHAKSEEQNKATANAITKQLETKLAEQSTKEQEKCALDLNAKLKVTQTGKQLSIKWGKVDSANKYNVYVAYCGSKYKLAATTKNTKLVLKKVNGKTIDATKNLKVYVEAIKTMKKKNVSIAKSINAHVVGEKNVTYTNAKSIKLVQKTVTLKKGKTTTINARTVLVDNNKKLLSNVHGAEFRYMSTDDTIAGVTKKGKITAKKVGISYIYVYAKNGIAKKVKVIVIK